MEQVMDANLNPRLKIDVQAWYTTLCDPNGGELIYIKAVEVARTMLSITPQVYEDSFEDACDAVEVQVRLLGQEINTLGGFEAMSAAFYVLINFVVAPDDRDGRTKIGSLKAMWHGIGEWRY